LPVKKGERNYQHLKLTKSGGSGDRVAEDEEGRPKARVYDTKGSGIGGTIPNMESVKKEIWRRDCEGLKTRKICSRALADWWRRMVKRYEGHRKNTSTN